MPRNPLPDPARVLPAYESLEATIRRIVRDELRPMHELLEQLHAERISEEPIPVVA